MVGARIDKEHSGSTIVRAGAIHIVLRNKIAISKSNEEDNLGHDERNSARYMDMWVQV